MMMTSKPENPCAAEQASPAPRAAIPTHSRYTPARTMLAVALVFLLRGLAIQCLYPPLEGPDEYQHVAYFQYLLENHRLPVYGTAHVPQSLYKHLAANPHSTHDWEQTGRIGCLRYSDFYDRRPTLRENPRILLYQAQHPPLYYVTVLPLYAWARSAFGFRGAVYGLRLLNLGFAAVALALLLTPLRQVARDRRVHTATALAAAMSPMFMIYVSRVANDALALLFGGAAVWLLTKLSDARQPGRIALLAGGCVGLGMITKMTVLAVLPAGLVYLVSLALYRRTLWKRLFRSVTGLAAGCLAVSAPFCAWSLKTYGVLFPAQETIRNAAAGRTGLDLLKAVDFAHIPDFFVLKLTGGTLWTSGWTFLPPHPVFRLLYASILLACLGGAGVWIYKLMARRARLSGVVHPQLLLCILLVAATAAAAYAHALNSILAYGLIATPSYYVMIAYPAFIICIAAAAKGYGRAAAAALMWGLAGLFAVTEIHSLLRVAVPHWTATTVWTESFRRLVQVHPAFPSPYYFGLFYAAALLVAVYCFRKRSGTD